MRLCGDRDHRPFVETVEEFVSTVKQAVASGGKILVPTFAIGRAQLLVGLLGWMFRRKRVAPFPIFLDSPMAIEATRIYTKHPELFDDGMKRFISEHPLRDDLVTLKVTASANDSKKINEYKGPCLAPGGCRNVQRRQDCPSSETQPLEEKRHTSSLSGIKHKTHWAAASWIGHPSSTFMARGFLYAHKSTRWEDSVHMQARRICWTGWVR